MGDPYYGEYAPNYSIASKAHLPLLFCIITVACHGDGGNRLLQFFPLSCIQFEIQ